MTTDRVGQQLGNYRLTRLLGRGGFAEVYLGEHTQLNTLAAIKVLQTQLAGSEAELFRKEGRMVAQLDHPNIVRVFDFDVQNNTPFLVMEYAPHGSLRAQHPRGVPVPLPTITSYIKQVAAALQYAHDHKIVHRDVKPENILVGNHQRILLSDFGISTLAYTTTSHNLQPAQQVAGTILYMSPEQIQGQARPASDQYALAVIVYEWLCGNPPFHGTFIEVATQHCLAPPPPLRQIMPMVPTKVEQVIFKALAKLPQQRFVNVKAFADALEDATNTEVTLPKSVFPVQNIAPEQKDSNSNISTPMLAQTIPSNTVYNPQPVSQPIARLSRRTIITSLAGLTLIGASAAGLALAGKTPWSFASAKSTPTTHVPKASSSQIPSPTPSSTPSPTPTSTNAPSTTPTTIYVGSTDNSLYALNAKDGSTLWHYKAKDWMNSMPVVANGVVYAGSNDHSLYALRASDGAYLWQFQAGDKIVSWPQLVNSTLYFGSWDRNIYAIHANNGSVLWSYPTNAFISSPTQVVDGVVYIGSGDHYVYAMQANNGNLLWRSRTNDIVAAMAVVDHGVVYVGSGDDSLYALRATDGVKLWHYQTGDAIYSAPAIVDGIIYFGSWDHYVYALRASDQSVLWRFLTEDKVASLPTVVNGVLYIGSSDGFVYALQANNGSVLWRHQTGGLISSKPILAAGVLYIGASNGLFALKASDGSLIWQFGNDAITTPTIV